MPRRRSGWTVWLGLVGLIAIGAGTCAWWAAFRQRAPWAVRAWTPVAETLASALASALPPASPPATEAADASAAPPDAGVIVHRQRTPLSSAQLGAPLLHGPFVPACGAPDSMKVTVQVAVKDGRAVDVHAKSTPGNPVVESCVEHAVRDLRWDASPKLGRVTVHY
jgi:hypothetical protein